MVVFASALDVLNVFRWSWFRGFPHGFPHGFAQQFLDGEKLVDGMLRRVRSAAMQAGRDPDERPGGTVELALIRWIGHLGIWDRMEDGWMDAANLPSGNLIWLWKMTFLMGKLTINGHFQ